VIALGIRYLTGYAVATNLARQRAEWPPHPGRVFLALAAAHFETGEDAKERAALEWLEAVGAPEMYASEANERSAVRAFVPVNDDHGGVLQRPRQERGFPRVRPVEDCVYLMWRAEPEAATRAVLAQLCGKVTRVGHSSSAVQMWVVAGEVPAANWIPDAAGEEKMRVAARGTMQSLDAAFRGAAIVEYDALAECLRAAKGKEKKRLQGEMGAKFPEGRPEWRRPQLPQWQGYRKVGGEENGKVRVWDGPFDDQFLVLAKEDGPVLGLESTQQLTGALRNAAMKAAGMSPEWLSGHDAEGAPSRHPHVAFFPLPFVGAEHADGHVLGLGIAVPRELGAGREEEVRRVLGPLFFDAETGEERTVEIWHGNVFRWTMEREKRERPPKALERSVWTAASRTWASVTPVVLHHHPKKREGHVAAILREAFVSALYPAPEAVQVTPVSIVAGVGHAREMPPYVQGGENLCRYQTHAVVRFAEPVRGPMLVGRGRFRGYGLFRPVKDEGGK